MCCCSWVTTLLPKSPNQPHERHRETLRRWAPSGAQPDAKGFSDGRLKGVLVTKLQHVGTVPKLGGHAAIKSRWRVPLMSRVRTCRRLYAPCSDHRICCDLAIRVTDCTYPARGLQSSRILARIILSSPRYTTHSVWRGFPGYLWVHAATAFSGLCMIQFRRASKPVRNQDFSRRPCTFRLMPLRPMTRVAQR